MVGEGQGGTGLKRGRLEAHRARASRAAPEHHLPIPEGGQLSSTRANPTLGATGAVCQSSCPGCWQLARRSGFEVSLAGFALAPAWPLLLLKTFFFFFNQPGSKLKKLAVQELGLLADSLGSICLHRLQISLPQESNQMVNAAANEITHH